MKRRFWAAICLLALWGQTARSAQASTLFDDFMEHCAAHTGDAPAALNSVSRLGWKMIPQQKLMSKVPLIDIPGLKTDWFHAYIGAESGRSLALFAGRGEFFSGTQLRAIPVAFCMTMQKPIDSASLERAASWTSAAPVSRGPGVSNFLFIETPEGRRSTTLLQMYHDFQAGVGRVLTTTNQPSEHFSSIILLSPALAHN